MKIDVCDMILILYGIITILYIISLYVKRNKTKNNVRFFVTKERDNCEVSLMLWMGAPKWDNKRGVWVPSSMHNHYLSTGDRFLEEFNIDPKDFTDMKECEIREVFINLKD